MTAMMMTITCNFITILTKQKFGIEILGNTLYVHIVCVPSHVSNHLVILGPSQNNYAILSETLDIIVPSQIYDWVTRYVTYM